MTAPTKAQTDTPGTLEDKPVGGDFSLRAFNVVRCLAQAEFRSEIDRCKDEAEYLMSTLRGEKQADYLRVHFPELDEIASLRARVEVLVDLLARYRNETPLGHQPHMIAHVADAAILAACQALAR